MLLTIKVEVTVSPLEMVSPLLHGKNPLSSLKYCKSGFNILVGNKSYIEYEQLQHKLCCVVISLFRDVRFAVIRPIQADVIHGTVPIQFI